MFVSALQLFLPPRQMLFVGFRCFLLGLRRRGMVVLVVLVLPAGLRGAVGVVLLFAGVVVDLGQAVGAVRVKEPRCGRLLDGREPLRRAADAPLL